MLVVLDAAGQTVAAEWLPIIVAAKALHEAQERFGAENVVQVLGGIWIALRGRFGDLVAYERIDLLEWERAAIKLPFDSGPSAPDSQC